MIGTKHMTFDGCCEGLREIFKHLQTHFHDQWNWMDADFFVEAMTTHYSAMQSRAEKAEEALARFESNNPDLGNFSYREQLRSALITMTLKDNEALQAQLQALQETWRNIVGDGTEKLTPEGLRSMIEDYRHELQMMQQPVTDEEIRRLESDLAQAKEFFADPFDDGGDEDAIYRGPAPTYEDSISDWIHEKNPDVSDVYAHAKEAYRKASIVQRLEALLATALASRQPQPKEPQ